MANLPPLNRRDRQRAFWKAHPVARLTAKAVPALLFATVLPALLGWIEGTAGALLRFGPPLALGVSYWLAVLGAYEPEQSRRVTTTSDHLANVHRRLGRLQSDLGETLAELDGLKQLAERLETEATDRQALASMSNEQLDALARRERRRDRTSTVRDVVLVCVGAALPSAVSHAWRLLT